MSKRILLHDNLGTLEQITFLLRDVLDSNPQKIENIQEYCLDISIEWAYSFKGVIDLIHYLAWISKNDNSQLSLTPSGRAISELPDKLIKGK